MTKTVIGKKKTFCGITHGFLKSHFKPQVCEASSVPAAILAGSSSAQPKKDFCCKYAYLWCIVGHFNMGVSDDKLTVI